MMREFFSFDCEIKAAPSGEIEGYAAAWTPDLDGDTITRGAFAASLKQRAGRRIPMLFNHDSGAPIGSWSALHEDQKGLHAVGRLTMSVPRAREAFDLIRDGAIDGLSIGYRVKDAQRLRGGGREIKELDLFEVSLVAIPANQDARVISVKAAELDTIRAFERFLHSAGFSQARAKTIAAHGFKGLSETQRDVETGLDELVSTVRKTTKLISSRTAEDDDGRRADHRAQRALGKLRGNRS